MGDVLSFVRKEAADALVFFEEDVFALTGPGVRPDDPVFPKGAEDYARLPELLEFAGLVSHFSF